MKMNEYWKLFNTTLGSQNVWRHSLLFRSHNLIVLSSEHETIWFPSGEGLAQRTQLVWPLYDARNLEGNERYSKHFVKDIDQLWIQLTYLDLFTAHNLTVLSSEAERICLPSGVKATDRTAAWCPFQKVLSPVMLGIQTANEPSWLQEAIRFPAGEKHTSFTPDTCPVNLERIERSWQWQRLTVGFSWLMQINIWKNFTTVFQKMKRYL